MRLLTPILLSAVLALSACGQVQPRVEADLHGAGGVNEQVGGVLLRDLSIEEPEDGLYDAGDAVHLRTVLLREGADTDALIDVSSPAVRDVRPLLDAECDGTAAQVEVVDLPITPADPVSPRPFAVELVLDTNLRSGETVPVIFTFRQAGSTTVQVPVELDGLDNVEDPEACAA